MKKNNVVIPIADLQACHRLKKNNNIILKIWNRAPGSAWWSFIDANRNKQILQLVCQLPADRTQERALLPFVKDEKGEDIKDLHK